MLLGTTGRCLYFAERPKHFQLPAVSAHTYISSDEDEKAPCRKRKRPYSCEQQCSAKKTKTCRLLQEKEAVATCASPAKTKCCPSIVYIMQLLLPFEHPAQTGSQNEKKKQWPFQRYICCASRVPNLADPTTQPPHHRILLQARGP